MISKNRATKETKIELELELYGRGSAQIQTDIGFFDHMLSAFAKHAWIDLNLRCEKTAALCSEARSKRRSIPRKTSSASAIASS